MNLNIYSIYDSAAKAYMSPFFMHNHGLAIRAFSDQVNATTDNQIKNHPEQFTLFHIAEYNDENGHIEPLDTPKPLGKGNEYNTEEVKIDRLDSLLKEFERLINKEQ